MKRIAKGGSITINSFLNEEDRVAARNHMLKTASSNMREAAKIGLQSLYADPKDVLEKYKDFDIVKEMQARKGAKLLWVRARAIDADTVNANGDYFSREELLKDVEIKGEKIPAYKTFEGVPIYTNHKNDDIEQAKGMVVYAEWDDEENCVYCTFFVDEEAYPDIARNIRTGVIHDVSMGCSVDYGICSKCKNKAYTEKDYCECLKKYKGKTHPDTGKRIYEENYNLKFIELSCVGDGAFEACEIQEIYDVDEVLEAADKLEKKATEIIANIALASEGIPNEYNIRPIYEDCLRTAKTTSLTAIRLAQQAGTLVGGQLLAGPGANQNSTVAAVLGALGIDPRSGLNVLDLINLSLNFLEVAVLNLFARKDNIDLTHVGKVTKAMADLQGTMQDMIDEGVDVGSGQRPQPINQQPAQPAQVAQQSASPQVGLASYVPGGNVGRVMEFTSPVDQNTIGGGIALASSNLNLVWASKSGRREIFASTNISENNSKTKIERFTENLLNLKNSLDYNDGVKASLNSIVKLANERNKNIKNNMPIMAGGTNQMDHFAKIASEQRKKLAAAVTIDFKVEDSAGNRVVLSTDGTITGYTNGSRTNWEPILSEHQLNMMESGQGTRVAAELLKDYSSFVKTALMDVKLREDVAEDNLSEVRTDVPYRSLGEGLAQHHKGNPADKTRGEELATKHSGEKIDNVENLLQNAGLYSRKDGSELNKSLSVLIDEVTKGVPTEVLEKQLASCRANGSASAHQVMSSTINALGRAVVKAMETPSRILKVAQMLSEEPQLPEMVGTAAAAAPMAAERDERDQFFDKDQEPMDSVSAVLRELGSAVSADVTAMDLAEALSVAVEEGEITREGVTRVAELLMKEAPVPEEGLDVAAEPSKTEELRAALTSAIEGDANLISKEDLKSAISAMAMSSEETGTTPEEVVDSVSEMDERQLVAAISRAKTATATDARLRARARREFWGVRTASSKDVNSNVIGWLADYSTNFNISSKKIALAAKRLCDDYEVAGRLVAKAIETKNSMEKTAAINVTQEKMDTIRFVCTCDDLGLSPMDDNFEDAFKQKAMSVLQDKGFTVDPNTFTFTNLNVSAHGDVTATVSSCVSKSFSVDDAESNGMESEVMPAEEGELPVVMTENAKVAQNTRRQNILNKYAQAVPGLGVAPTAPAPGPVDPTLGMATPGTDAGVLGLTGAEAPADMDAMPDEGTTEAGEKKPWGSICPVCGSDDVNISESNADCQSCGTTYEIHMSLQLVSKGDKGKAEEEGAGEGLGLGGDMGLGAATAPAETAPAAGGMPGAAPMAPMASSKSMFRLATRVDSDVYLRTAMPDFDKTSEKKLPVGMICPSCGSRTAHKVKNNTFCYDCGTFAKTTVKACKDNPSKLDVDITWID